MFYNEDGDDMNNMGYTIKEMVILASVLLIFTIIGAINWGLIGLFDINLVTLIFGEGSVLTRIVYIFIAFCGIVNIGILLSGLEHMD